MTELVRQYGRYGFRRIAEVLRSAAGWAVNTKGSNAYGGATG